MKEASEEIREFISACHRVAAQGLTRCSSGNLSSRLDHDRILISGSRVWMEDVTDKDVSIMRLSDGAVLSGPEQSSEWRVHQGILQKRADVSVVLHWSVSIRDGTGLRKNR